MKWLDNFAKESNRIEGILTTTNEQIDAHKDFIESANVSVADLIGFVSVVQPDATIRDQPHLNVRVGRHVAPKGGPEIITSLEEILALANSGDSWRVHSEYEVLHPFTDGNGRSGRALWLWMMLHSSSERDSQMARQLGFLHCFYY